MINAMRGGPALGPGCKVGADGGDTETDGAEGAEGSEGGDALTEGADGNEGVETETAIGSGAAGWEEAADGDGAAVAPPAGPWITRVNSPGADAPNGDASGLLTGACRGSRLSVR